MSPKLTDMDNEIDILENLEESEQTLKESKICCKNCHFLLTYPRYALSPKGQHQHLQCNPAGITFVFSCFSRATGCYINGMPSTEFSWFKNYEWQFALCQGCGEHLGWFFSRPTDINFFAIINNKMIYLND